MLAKVGETCAAEAEAVTFAVDGTRIDFRTELAIVVAEFNDELAGLEDTIVEGREGVVAADDLESSFETVETCAAEREVEDLQGFVSDNLTSG